MNASSHLWVHSFLVNVTFFTTHCREQSQGNSPREILNKWSKISEVRVTKESKAVDLWSKVKIMKNSPIGRRFILKKHHFESKMFWKLWLRLWYHPSYDINFLFFHRKSRSYRALKLNETTLFVFSVHSVQSLSHVWLFVTPWTAAHQTSLSFTNSWSLRKPMSIELVMPSNHLILCPLLLPPSIFPSIRVFSSESVLHIKWSKYWGFSFSISPSNEYSGLISFRMDWLDLLAVPGTLKNLLQHHSSKASILQCSPFFILQLSHPYMTTGKTIPMTRQTFVDKVISLLFNMLFRLAIAFLPRSKCLLISWLQSFNFICSDFGAPQK